ncbi:GT4 family glycosyltransferase PelF [Clostridium sediminicola]|uniref:GT4 family glycosyltransferase PelF n=1 Tax=Clostridium sediminicola TaxID=3114879 RepID=UPI0031F25E1D
MKICIIAEGSYPFITGGVSSWIQTLITNMEEHQFIIYAIAAEEKFKGNYKYELPPNVIEVKELFLESYIKKKGSFGKHYNLGKNSNSSIESLITGDDFDWSSLIKLIHKGKIKSIDDFFVSKDFFNIVKNAYRSKYNLLPFNEFFWMVHSMLMPLFYLVREDLPKADIYHSVATGYAGIIGSMGKIIYNKPFLLTEHGIYTREREEEIIKSNWVKGYFKDMWIRFFYNLSRCAYNESTKVTTIHSKNKEIEIDLGCDKDKISVIPNAVNADAFNNINKKSLKDPNINIGAILRIVPIKDIKTMIQSFTIVKNEIPNAKFFLMGPTDEDEDYYDECVKFINMVGLKDITFTGRVNVKDYIGKMDITVLSSISEGQPLVILESLACKIPCVATDVGSCRELLYGNEEYDTLGKCGFITPVMNYQKLAEAIIKLSENPDLRKQMGEIGYKRVTSFYKKEDLISSYKKVYYDIERTNFYGRNRI